MAKSIISAALISTSHFGAIAQTLDEIVAKHIEAVGGKANWNKIQSLKMEGVITDDNGVKTNLVVFQIDKKARRENIVQSGKNGYSIITTTEGWSFMPFMEQKNPEAMSADYIKNSQDELSIADEFLTYAEQGKTIEYKDTDDVDGVECFKIRITNKNENETTYYLDQKSFFIIKKKCMTKEDGAESTVTTLYSDYKKMDSGIVYPIGMTTGFGLLKADKVEFNLTIDEHIFKSPIN